MKTSIPEALKEDIPHTFWGKILSATPIVLTVIATMLAGLSSSEMTRAQYDRSMAAQLQSKAGDQWNFFQGKKLRGAVQRSALDVIQAGSEVQPLDEAVLREVLIATDGAALLETPEVRAALPHLLKGSWPAVEFPQPPPALAAVLHAIEASVPDMEIDAMVRALDPAAVDHALSAARAATEALDAATGPVGKTFERLETHVSQKKVPAEFRRPLSTARLGFNSQRYDAEARFNQSIALLHEVLVRRSNISAERHHRRSERFFYGMLAAQMGVIVSTLAMAARKRNLLWSIAAIAGVVAIAFAVYVYLYV